MSELLHIGTNTRITIEEGGYYRDIPAKVDTGADISSIWASDIKKIKGVLSFKLFDIGYVKFSGKAIKTTEFKKYSIKNSFGVSEFRYKVRLKVHVGNLVVEDFFTLANRSNNTHPVLLGKTFLEGRFVVDVSKGDILSEKALKERKILVVTTRIDKKVKEFYRTVTVDSAQHNISIDVVKFKDLRFELINDTMEVYAKNEPVSHYSLVYIKSYKLAVDQALALARFCRFISIPLIDEELQHTELSLSKLSEAVKLKSQRLPVIDSVVVSKNQALTMFDKATNQFGLPFVVKDAFSDRGKNNVIIFGREDFSELVSGFSEDSLPILQRFIPNDGFYRVVLFDYSPKMIIFRGVSEHSNANKSHLNKPAGGANSELIPVDEADPSMVKLAKKCSKIMKRNIAGVDLIQDKNNGKWYILEVNYNPSMVSDNRSREKAFIFSQYVNNKLNRKI